MATGVKVNEVMTAKISHVGPECAAHLAIARMADEGISCLLVCEGDWPVGIVTERDIVRFVAKNTGKIDATRKQVADIMTSPVDTISVDSSLEDLLSMLEVRNYRHLPVTDDAGSLVGVVTQSNLIRSCAMIIRHSE